MPAASGARPRIAGLAAAAAFAVSSAVWWQAGVAEKYMLAAAIVAWTMVALRRALDPGGERAFLLACLGFGVSVGVHPMGLYLVPLLAWVWWRRGAAGGIRDARGAMLAVLLVAIPLGARALYPPLRAHARSSVNAGVPDRLYRFLSYQASSRYVGPYLLHDASLGGLAGAAVQHVLVLPWREIGPLVLLALLGAGVVWRRDRRTAWLIGGLFLSNAAFGVGFQAPEVERACLPACLALAVLAGAGAGWLAERWRWAPVPCACILLWVASANAPLAMRDRDTIATDHARNLLLFVHPGDLVAAWGDAWLYPLEHARLVDARPEAARVETAEALRPTAPERAVLAAAGDARLAPLLGGAGGPALFWQLRRAAGGGEVWLNQEAPPDTIPSRGARWRGLLVRITDPREGFGLDDPGTRWMRGLRLHSLVRAQGYFEETLVRFYAYALNSRALLLVRAGQGRDAETVARLGLRLKPDLPELRETLGRALMLQGRSGEAVAEWKAAIVLTRGAYLDPYLGLEEAVRRRGGPTAEDEALEWLRTAAELGAPGRVPRAPPVAEGDAARSLGRWAAARTAYRRAVALGLLTRGFAHFQAGRLPQAGAAWDDALGFDPRASQVMEDLGTLAALEERFDDALRWYRAARAAGPWSRELDENIERTAEAIVWQPKVAVLEAAARRSPRDPGALVLAGNAEWYVGRTKPAEAYYRRALRLDPGHVRALTNLASTLVQQGRAKEAIPLYERAVRADPAYTSAMVNLAAVYLGMGDRARGEAWLARTLSADPKQPQALRMMKDLGR
jgi:tetratricopeptide (TPR) repeat protein